MAARKRSTSRKSSSTGNRRTNRRAAPRRKPAARPRVSLDLHQKALIVGIAAIFTTAVILLSLLSPSQGRLTAALSDAMGQGFGWGGVIVPLALGLGGFYLVLWGMDQPPRLPGLRLGGLLLLFLAFEAIASLALVAWGREYADVWEVAQAQTGGGYLGGLVAYLLSLGVGRLGAVVVLLITGVIAAVLAAGVSRADLGAFVAHLSSLRQAPAAEREIAVNTGRSRAPAPPAAAIPARGDSAPTPVPVPARAATPAPTRRSRSRAAAAETVPDDQIIAPEPVFHAPGMAQSWTLPNVNDILEAGGEQEIGDTYIREQVEIIEHTLESFGAPASVVEINQGPTITQYGVEPSFVEQRGGRRTKVKVGKIASLADDLALALAARSIRIQAPVPGKGYVGIEVPNSEKALVSLRDVMESAEFQKIRSPLRLGLGQNVAGQPIAADLTQMPHLLIAGTTGSGKSVCVNSIIACLLLQNNPDDLRLVMVDPKRVELTGYNGIPHLVAPVVVDLDRVVGTLHWAMREMDGRYKRLAEAGARNIAEFNKKALERGEPKMPYIIFFIDELADLMMLSPEETERGITRLAQMARATGIHMVIATQRPSVDVVTGLIKANFPARIAFAVASSTDSRVILDTTGAERLLGQGDMLFQSPDAAAPVRMQGCFVGEKELHNLIDYWRTAQRFSRIAPAAVTSATVPAAAEAEAGATAAAPAAPPAEPAPIVQPPLWEEMRAREDAAEAADELLPEAIEMVRKSGKASTSLLQRRFRIGYTRAARLMDMMEEAGIIGPPTGNSKAREVLPAGDDNSTAEDGGAEEAAGLDAAGE